MSCELDADGAQELRRQIDEALTEAAPDLDEIHVEVASGAIAAA